MVYVSSIVTIQSVLCSKPHEALLVLDDEMILLLRKSLFQPGLIEKAMILCENGYAQ